MTGAGGNLGQHTEAVNLEGADQVLEVNNLGTEEYTEKKE